MDKCPGLIGGINDPSTSCNIPSAVQETILGVLDALPGNNPVTPWGTNLPKPAGGNSSSVSPSTSTLSTNTSAASTPTVLASTAMSNGYDTSYGAVIPTSSSSLAGVSPASTYGNVVSVSTGVSTTLSASVMSSPMGYSTSSNSVTASATAETTMPSSTSPNSGIVSIPGWNYTGCYSDLRDQRVLSGVQFADLGNGKVTSSGCIEYCGARSFSIAGTEYGGQCFCGDELVGSSPLAESDCAIPCEGDGSELCGGGLALSVYETSAGSMKKLFKSKRAHRHLAGHRGKRY